MINRRYSEFAIAGFTLGLISFIQLAGIEKALVAIVFGVLALRNIGSSGNEERGEGLAAAAIVLGIIYAIVAIVFLVILMKNPELLEQIVKHPMAR